MHIITNMMILDGMENAIKAGKLQAVEAPDPVSDACLYRDGNGCRCAIGASLPEAALDELEASDQNSSGIALVEWGDLSIEFENWWFAVRIQDVHDHRGYPASWTSGSYAHVDAAEQFGEKAMSLLEKGKTLTAIDWIRFIAAVREHLETPV